MMKKFCTKHLATAVVLILALGSGPSAKARIRPAADASTIFVGDVEQLYSAVNDPGNAGAVIVLAAGTYALTATDALGVPRPNGGRLDLQFNMSLLGVEGDGGAVTIDASALPGSSFAFKVGRTGVIRTGRGKSTIAWLTVAGNPLAASAIGTDLVQTDPADPTATALPAALRVAHVSAHDSARGVDVRNAAPDTSGRRIVAEIEDSEFSRGVEGIRVINFAQADRGEITVDLGRNYSHENVEGCIIENNRSNFASIAVRSYGDRFDDNGAGCEIGGALIASKTGTANANTTRFDAFGSQFTNNTRTEFSTPRVQTSPHWGLAF